MVHFPRGVRAIGSGSALVITLLTLAGCTAETNPATNVTPTTATLRGSVTVGSQDQGGDYWFEWSRDGGATWTQGPHHPWGDQNCEYQGSGTEGNPVAISENVAGLVSGSHYIFRVAGRICDLPVIYGDSNWRRSGDGDPPYEYDSFDTPAATHPGDRDMTFGTAGLASVSFGDNAPARASFVQSDQKLVIGGEGSNPRRFLLARFTAGGQLDTATFGTTGTGGKVSTDFPGISDVTMTDVIRQPDGKIIAVGDGAVSQQSSGLNWLMSRYNLNGTLDTNFGNGGKVADPFAHAFSPAIALQSTGKIVLGGTVRPAGEPRPPEQFALARYNYNGTPDTSFGIAGRVFLEFGDHAGISGLAIQPDNKIVAVGHVGKSFDSRVALARFNPNGTIDPTFGTNGTVVTRLGDPNLGTSTAGAPTILPDGKILVGGGAYIDSASVTGYVWSLALARYNTDGSLDSTFGSDGIVVTDLGTGANGAVSDLAVQSDGRVVVSATNDANQGFLARFAPTGRVDFSFGVCGRAFGSGQPRYDTIALQGSNHVIAVGGFPSQNPIRFSATRHWLTGADDSSRCSHQQLLNMYAPEMRYDLQENYQADSAAMITDNWGSDAGLWQTGSGSYSNVLWDGDGSATANGDLLATSEPGDPATDVDLNLDTLGPRYPGGLAHPNGLPADSNDWIDERNNHENDAALLHAAGYGDHIYGHIVQDQTGALWLQYWFFFYYNDFEVQGFGVHEGDWEMIQVRLDSSFSPDRVDFAQHTGGATCTRGEFETAQWGGPVVFTGVQSHASFPRMGAYTVPGPAGHDHAPGDGQRVVPQVEEIADGDPSWVAWPGRWGNSRSGSAVESNSPLGPAQLETHSQWANPLDFPGELIGCMDNFDPDESPYGRSASARLAREARPRPPEIRPRIVDRRVRVQYRVSQPLSKRRWPRMLISLDARKDRLPPRTYLVKNLKRGRFAFPFQVKPAKRWRVLASLFTRNGERSRTVTRRVLR